MHAKINLQNFKKKKKIFFLRTTVVKFLIQYMYSETLYEN